MHPDLQVGIAALKAGRIVLLYDGDGREEETDMVVASQHVDADLLRTLRQDAGGLVCTTLAPEHHAHLGLPFLSDLIQAAADEHPVLAGLLPDDIQYDASKPAFGLTVNHRDTFTGITDADRALTITALEAFLGDLPDDPAAAQKAFGDAFRAPGHVTLLNGAPGGLAARQGHTELSIALMRLAGLTPSATICEMLGPDGKALPRKEAQAYAREHGLVFIAGQQVMDACRPIENPLNAE